MQILLVHPNRPAASLLAFAIESNFDAQVKSVTLIEAAIDLLASKRDFVLVLYASSLEDSELFKKFLLAKHGIPTIRVTENEEEQDAAETIRDGIDTASQEGLITTVCAALEKQIKRGLLKLLDFEEQALEYCRIPLQMAADTGPLEAPVFVQLSERKYVKLINQGDSFSIVDMERLSAEKKIQYLHIKKQDFPIFMRRFKRVIARSLTDSQIDLALTISAQEIIQQLAATVGFTEEVKELVDQQVELTLKTVENLPGLQALLAKVEQEEDRYLAAHSMLTAYVACSLAKAMGYESDPTFRKLTTAALLHDITLDSHELAMVRTREELDSLADQFTEKELQAFAQHPVLAAEIAGLVAAGIPDVDTIILQHHEFGDGTGFPHHLGSLQVSPLAALFIVAHELVLSTIEGGLRDPQHLQELAKKFSQNPFKAVFKQVISNVI